MLSLLESFTDAHFVSVDNSCSGIQAVLQSEQTTYLSASENVSGSCIGVAAMCVDK